jgi:hypothetical protein
MVTVFFSQRAGLFSETFRTDCAELVVILLLRARVSLELDAALLDCTMPPHVTGSDQSTVQYGKPPSHAKVW